MMIKRLCLIVLAIGTLITANPNKKYFNLVVSHEFDLNELSMISHVSLGKKELFCKCGSNPVIIMIIYGHLEVYCFDCAPRINIDTFDGFRF